MWWGEEEDDDNGGVRAVSYEVSEEHARTQYNSALRLMQKRNFLEAKLGFDLVFDTYKLVLPDNPFRSRLFKSALKNSARCSEELGDHFSALKSLVLATNYVTSSSSSNVVDNVQENLQPSDVSLWIMLRRSAKRNMHLPLFQLADSVLVEHQQSRGEYVYMAPPEPQDLVVTTTANDDNEEVKAIQVLTWKDLIDGLAKHVLNERVKFKLVEDKPPAESRHHQSVMDFPMEMLNDASLSSVPSIPSLAKKPMRPRRSQHDSGGAGGDEDNSQSTAAFDASLETLLPEVNTEVWKQMLDWFEERSRSDNEIAAGSNDHHVRQQRFKSQLVNKLFLSGEEEEEAKGKLAEQLVDLLMTESMLLSEAMQRCITYFHANFASIPLSALSSFYALCVKRRFDLLVEFQWIGSLSLLSSATATSVDDDNALELFVLECALQASNNNNNRELAIWTLKRSEERGYFLRNFALVELSINGLQQLDEDYANTARQNLQEVTSKDKGLWSLDSLLPTSPEFALNSERCIRKGVEICLQQRHHQQQAGMFEHFFFKTALHLIARKQTALLDLLFTLVHQHTTTTTSKAEGDDEMGEYFVCRLLSTYPRLASIAPAFLSQQLTQALPYFWVWCAETNFTAGLEWLKSSTMAAPSITADEKEINCVFAAMMQTKAYSALMFWIQGEDRLTVLQVLLKLDETLSKNMLCMLMAEACSDNVRIDQIEDEDEEDDELMERESLMAACAQHFCKPEVALEQDIIDTLARFCAAQFWCKGSKAGLKVSEKRILAERLTASTANDKPWFHMVQLNCKRGEHLGELQFKTSTADDFKQLGEWLKHDPAPGFYSLFVQLKLDFMDRPRMDASLLAQLARLEQLREWETNEVPRVIQVGTVVKTTAQNKQAVVAYIDGNDGYCDLALINKPATTTGGGVYIVRHVALQDLEFVSPNGDVAALVHDYDMFQEFDEYSAVIRYTTATANGSLQLELVERLHVARQRYPKNWQFAWLQGIPQSYEDALRILNLSTFEEPTNKYMNKKVLQAKKERFEYERRVAISDLLCRIASPDYQEAIKVNASNLLAALRLSQQQGGGNDELLEQTLLEFYNANRRYRTSWFVWEHIQERVNVGLVEQCVAERFALAKQRANKQHIAVTKLFEFCRPKKIKTAVELGQYLTTTLLPMLDLADTFETYLLLKGKEHGVRRKFELRLVELGKRLDPPLDNLELVIEHCKTHFSSSDDIVQQQQRRASSKLYKPVKPVAQLAGTRKQLSLLVLLSVQRVHRLGALSSVQRLTEQDVQRISKLL